MTESSESLGIEEMAQHPMEILLQQELDLPAAGDIRKGWVIDHRNNEILVDIGAKSEGIIPMKEVEGLDDAALQDLAVGNEVSIYVVDAEDQKGNIILSYVRAAQEQDWLIAQELHDKQDAYRGVVIGHNKGGVLVKVGQLRGFVPNSQLDLDHFSQRQITSDNLRKLVGKPITVKVLEVNRERSRLILSERAASRERREAMRAELLARIAPADEFEGRVVNITDYGAFVDIGGIEGLVHVSELSWKRVKDPSTILKVGEEVKVSVISVDQDKQRIALSMKRLQADPWTEIDDLYREGQLIEATITKLTKFGAFARLTDDYELEGLIHISELAEEHVNHPRDVVKPEDVVTVRIIRVDSEQRQLGLSIKQVSSSRYLEADMAMLSSS